MGMLQRLMVMLDIEALSPRPNALVCSIGAVRFVPGSGQIESTYYAVLDWADQQQRGRHLHAHTVAFWLRQPREAQLALLQAGTTPNLEALQKLIDFVDGLPIWANGPDYDCVTLRSLLEDYHLTPWALSQNRCYRTVKALHGDRAPEPKRVSEHQALEDAKHQALYLSELLRAVETPEPRRLRLVESHGSF